LKKIKANKNKKMETQTQLNPTRSKSYKIGNKRVKIYFNINLNKIISQSPNLI
jgi:hypothetical protein